MQLVQSLQLPHILLQAWVLIEIIQYVTTQSLKGKVNVHISHIKCSSHLSVNFHGTLHFLPSWTVWHARLPLGNPCREPPTVTLGAGLFVSSPEPPSCPLCLGIAWCNRWNSVKASAQIKRDIYLLLSNAVYNETQIQKVCVCVWRWLQHWRQEKVEQLWVNNAFMFLHKTAMSVLKKGGTNANPFLTYTQFKTVQRQNIVCFTSSNS